MNDLNEVEWECKLDSKGCDYTCSKITLTQQEIVAKYTKLKRNKNNLKKLPWLCSPFWDPMKQRDLALKTF